MHRIILCLSRAPPQEIAATSNESIRYRWKRRSYLRTISSGEKKGKHIMKLNLKLKRLLTFILAFALFCGLVPVDMKVASAKTSSVSLTSLGRKGTVNFGSKSKSGTWWQMHLNGKKAFCIDLGYTCHSGNTYSAEETHHWDQDTGGAKNGYYAKIIRWYVLDKKRSNKAFVMSQALIWSIAEERNSESQLKDVIKQVKQNIGISPSKTVKELYEDIFEPGGDWKADLTFWKKTGNSKKYQRLLTVDAEESDTSNYVPKVISDSDYYRQRITVKKKDEDGNGLGGVQFTLEADNLDDLYSFAMTDRDGTDSTNAEENNDTEFTMTGKTRDSGRIAFRMTYKIYTMGYFYYSDADLEKMSSAEKKDAKKFLTDTLDLDEGVDFPSDLKKDSAKKMMNKEMKELKASIKNTYTLKEDNTGSNKHIILDADYAKGVKITLTSSDSWERDTDGEWPETKISVASDYSKAHTVDITNRFKKATINVVKTDKYSKDKKAHGDAALDGAQFELYADKDCKNKATVFDAKGKAKTAGTYTVKGGKVETDYLRSGMKYYLKEVKAPKGYFLSDEVVEIAVDASAKTVEFTKALSQKEFGNQPVLGKIAIQKYTLDNKTGETAPEVGAKFQVWLTSKGSFDKCDEYERAEITTDSKGYGETGNLYYGKYTVHQVDCGEVDTYLAEDFQAEVTENGKTYTFPVNNILFKAYLRILKKDGNTEEQVLKAGTTYQIYKVTGEKEELVTQTYENGNKKETVDRFVTDETGEIMTVDELKSGTYRIYETEAPTGYHIKEKYIEVTINSKADNYESYTDNEGNRHAVITLTYTNEETYGKLKLYKSGEVLTGFADGKFVYEERLLKGAIFEVYAAEDIVTQDNQKTNWYDKGDLVTTITTGEGAKFEKECKGITASEVDEAGMVTVNLPLGKYQVREKQTLYGYVLPDKAWDVEFDWKNKDEEFVLNATDMTDEDGVLRVKNERAKALVSLLKTDSNSKKAIEGAVFGIYTKYDIYNADGEKIVDAGTQVGTMMTDAKGKAVSDADLPLMSEGFDRSKLPAMPQTAATKALGASEIPDVRLTGPATALPTGIIGEAISTTIPAKKVAAIGDPSSEPEATDIPDTTKTPDEENGSAGSDPKEASSDGTSPDGNTGNGTLNSGDYYLKEISVSDSYYLDETEHPVHLEYQDAETAVITESVEAVNKQTTTTISKQSVTSSKELKGCRLEILDQHKKVIVRWTSGDKTSVKFSKNLDSLGYRNMTSSFDKNGSVVIGGLFHDTKYVLKETRPADGYVTADSISFELIGKEKGETAVAFYQGDEMVMQDGNKVIMIDDTTKIRLIKLSSDTGQGLPGAKFVVLDSKGAKVLSFTSTEDGVDITGKLVVGKTYTFKEIEAPKGYKLAKPVKYKVKDTGKLQKISVTDKKNPKPHVPQTGGMTPFAASASALLMLLGGSLLLFFKRRLRR